MERSDPQRGLKCKTNHFLFILHLSVIIAMLAACTKQPASPPSQSTVIPVANKPEAIASPTPAGLPTPTSVPTAYPGALYVDAAQDLGPISPLVYGSNYGPWLFVTMEMQPKAVDAKLTYLRWPGGNWGDQNDIDEWQVDQYIATCKQFGTEPSISVRLKDGTPEKAADLVKLVNITKGYKVRYWSIGNEPDLYKNGYETDQYNQDWRKFAQAMRAVDPSILFVGPDISQFTANPAVNRKDANGKDWMAEFLKANGDMVDIVSIHRYPFPVRTTDGAPTIADLRANSQEWDKIIPYLRSSIRENTGRDLPVAVTEVNSSWANNGGGEATLDSLYNAIWWGDSLGRMIRQNVDIVAQFALIGELGLLAKYQVHPIYYVYPMYQHFGTERLFASSDNPDLSVFAAKRQDGTLTVMVINLGIEETSYPLRLSGNISSAASEVWRLDASHQAENIGSQSITSGEAITLPGESMTLYVFPAK